LAFSRLDSRVWIAITFIVKTPSLSYAARCLKGD
jgi:hypothetical protein